MAKGKKGDREPRFPYTTIPAALRRLLNEIPKRPKPGKITLETMKTWKVINTNDASPIGVLKKLGLLSANGEPLQPYSDYMLPPPAGPKALGARIKDVYRELFETAHEPHKNPDELRTFFNIHSGGSDRAIDLQVQTFKALMEYADISSTGSEDTGGKEADLGARRAATPSAGKLPPVQIDLHIHLPENKTARDYEAIIQDIAKYIYGRPVDRS